MTKDKIKVLNLYAGIGGNRKLWTNVDVTAVEINPEIAKIYQDFFPEDKVIVGDAHKYLLEHYKEFDFIWSSPPCPSHSRARYWASKGNKFKVIYPDMKLYQEIILLQNYANCLWVIENVIGYYIPLITPVEIHRHYFWSNFQLIKKRFNRIKTGFSKKDIHRWSDYHGFDISKYQIKSYDKRQILRNCVYPKLGLHVFNCAFKTKQVLLSNLNKGGG